MYVGDFASGASVDVIFTTVGTTGAPTQLAGTPAISVYKANNATESTTGVTLTADYDSRTGMNHVRIVTTDAFYAVGNDYHVVITTGTVGGTSVVGYRVAQFSIENRSGLRPTTAGRTLDVSAGGEAGVDWANVGSPTTTLSLSGTTVATVTTTTTATNLTTVSAGAISAGSFAAGAIDAAAIAADAIGAAEIANGAIDAATFAAGAIDAAAIAADAIGSSELAATAANEIRDAIFQGTMTQGYAADGAAATLEQMMYMLWSALSEFAISGTTLTCRQLDGTTTSMTFTLNSATAPTSRTRAT